MAIVANLGDPTGRIDKAVTSKHLATPFRPNSEFALITPTGTGGGASPLPRDQNRPDDCVRIYNTGTVPVRYRFGGAASVAGPSDKAVAPGTVEILRCSPSATHIALYSATAGSVEINCGEGI